MSTQNSLIMMNELIEINAVSITIRANAAALKKRRINNPIVEKKHYEKKNIPLPPSKRDFFRAFSVIESLT